MKAEDLYEKLDINDPYWFKDNNKLKMLMIEFAKYHVEKALEAASENNTIDFIDLKDGEKFEYFDVLVDSNIQAVVSKESILNSYPLENIK